MGAETFKTKSDILIKVRDLKMPEWNAGIWRSIYCLIAYLKLNRFLCIEDKFFLDKEVRAYGLVHGVENIVRGAKHCLHIREDEKKQQIDSEASLRKANSDWAEIEARYNYNEADQLSGLTQAEIELRDKPYPGGMYAIPDEVIYHQRVLESGNDGEIEWMILNKVYGCWYAIVTSPHRIKPDGKKGVVLMRNTNWRELKVLLRCEIIREENRQKEFMAARSKKPNINRVRKVMGLDGIDPNLSGDDIF
jgi:hypothetical protein